MDGFRALVKTRIGLTLHPVVHIGVYVVVWRSLPDHVRQVSGRGNGLVRGQPVAVGPWSRRCSRRR